MRGGRWQEATQSDCRRIETAQRPDTEQRVTLPVHQCSRREGNEVQCDGSTPYIREGVAWVLVYLPLSVGTPRQMQRAHPMCAV